MAESISSKFSRKSIKWLILGGLTVVFLIGFMFAGIRSWLVTPRVKVTEVEKLIATSLPLGTPRKNIEAWLTARSMIPQHYKDESGHTFIQSWVPDSGPPAEKPYGIRDLRIQFFFDEDERLMKFTVQEEDRF